MDLNAKKPKRQRTANFTAEEKLRFVRVLQEKGQCIISKVTAHDANTNKEKEIAWQNITTIHNSSGHVTRTTDNLKKLWTKLKSEAKTFKASSRHSVSGTGGGPLVKFEDPVLELVIELTGRGSTGILEIDDCDVNAEDPIQLEDDLEQHTAIEYLDDEIFVDDFPENQIIIIKEEKNEEGALQPSSVEIKTIKSHSDEKKSISNNKSDREKEDGAKRRQPPLCQNNERSEVIKKKKRENNRFAAERLRAEQEKSALILQQKRQNAELHDIKMENEKLKNLLLKTLLKKVSGTDTTQVLQDAIQFLNHDI